MNSLLRVRFTTIAIDRFEANVAISPTGATATINFVPPAIDSHGLDQQLREWRARVDARESTEPGSPRDLGIAFFKALFRGDVRDVFIASRKRCRFLQLQLDFASAPQLSLLPWEYLCDPDGRFLTEDGIRITRHLGSVNPVDAEPLLPPLNILIVAAFPRDQIKLSPDEDATALEGELSTLRRAGAVIVDNSKTRTYKQLLRKLLEDEYDVLHFVGHGSTYEDTGEGFLFFEDDDGNSDPVAAGDFGQLLKEHPSIRLVVLNTCHGATGSADNPFSGTAQTLVRDRIPAVVGMQRAITNRAAIEFATGFYEAVAAYQAIDAAVARGRLAIRVNAVEWGTPALYLQTQTIFLPPPPKTTQLLMDHGGAHIVDVLSLAKPGNVVATGAWGIVAAMTAAVAVAALAVDIYHQWFNLAVVPFIFDHAMSGADSLLVCGLVALGGGLVFALLHQWRPIRAVGLDRWGYPATQLLATYFSSAVVLFAWFSQIPPTLQMRQCDGVVQSQAPQGWERGIRRDSGAVTFAETVYQEARWYVGSGNVKRDLKLEIDVEPRNFVQFDRLHYREGVTNNELSTCSVSIYPCVILDPEPSRDWQRAVIMFSVGSSSADKIEKVKREPITARIRVSDDNGRDLGEASLRRLPAFVPLSPSSAELGGSAPRCGDWR